MRGLRLAARYRQPVLHRAAQGKEENAFSSAVDDKDVDIPRCNGVWDATGTGAQRETVARSANEHSVVHERSVTGAADLQAIRHVAARRRFQLMPTEDPPQPLDRIVQNERRVGRADGTPGTAERERNVAALSGPQRPSNPRVFDTAIERTSAQNVVR